MCGIAGIVQALSGISGTLHGTIEAMVSPLEHRGPDDQGAWVDEAAGLAFGHRRLSILDLSPEGRQPMVSASGRYVIIFNGEIYNHDELRAEICAASREHSGWRGHSDTEVMLAAIEVWGVSRAVGSFSGMFAFALWDRAERRLFLARDRIGEKPLYYGQLGNSFVFASELKALRVHPAWRGEIDRTALSLFLQNGYVPGPYSIYRGINKLPAGSILEYVAQTGEWQVHFYWQPDELLEHFAGSEQEAVDELEQLLLKTVAREMVADVPLGAFLSGGIDSSLIVALMKKTSSTPIKTFTIGFHEKAYDEAPYANAVAKILGTDHHELYVKAEEARDVIPRLPMIYDEPFADSSQIPTFLISSLAARHVKVCLSGDGGDELFGGYGRYFETVRGWRSTRRLPNAARHALGQFVRSLSGTQAFLPKISTHLPERFGRRLRLDKLERLNAILSAGKPEELYQKLLAVWSHPGILVEGEPGDSLGAVRNSQADDIFEWMMSLDLRSYLPDDVMVKVDRASMAVSLETRAPFLDHTVVEFAKSLPLAMKIREGVGKRPLRKVLSKHLPAEMFERPKMGFGVPVGEWLRGPLKEWAEELLDEKRLQTEDNFLPGPIRSKWREHLAGHANWEHQLWCVLMFQAWYEDQRATSIHSGSRC